MKRHAYTWLLRLDDYLYTFKHGFVTNSTENLMKAKNIFIITPDKTLARFNSNNEMEVWRKRQLSSLLQLGKKFFH